MPGILHKIGDNFLVSLCNHVLSSDDDHIPHEHGSLVLTTAITPRPEWRPDARILELEHVQVGQHLEVPLDGFTHIALAHLKHPHPDMEQLVSLLSHSSVLEILLLCKIGLEHISPAPNSLTKRVQLSSLKGVSLQQMPPEAIISLLQRIYIPASAPMLVPNASTPQNEPIRKRLNKGHAFALRVLFYGMYIQRGDVNTIGEWMEAPLSIMIPDGQTLFSHASLPILYQVGRALDLSNVTLLDINNTPKIKVEVYASWEDWFALLERMPSLTEICVAVERDLRFTSGLLLALASESSPESAIYPCSQLGHFELQIKSGLSATNQVDLFGNVYGRLANRTFTPQVTLVFGHLCKMGHASYSLAANCKYIIKEFAGLVGDQKIEIPLPPSVTWEDAESVFYIRE